MSMRDAINKAMNPLRNRRVKPNVEPWEGSDFEEILSFSVDERGQIGENLVANILGEYGCDVDFQPGKTDSYGRRGYDLKVDDIKIEVKFATRGRNNVNFQHENLHKQTGWDAIILIDVAPDAIYVVMEPKMTLPWDKKANWPKKMHRRKDSTFYKFDLTVRHHELLESEVETMDDFFNKFVELKEKLSD